MSLALQRSFQELRVSHGRSATIVTDKNRYLAALLAFSLGWIGIHKYYMGQIGWGIAYTLFSWTFIPALAATIEGILYLTRSDEDFVRRYGRPTLLESHTILQPNSALNPGIDYERFLLQFARQHKGRISLAHLMADSQLDLDQAEEALARLAAKGLVESEISPQGQLHYIVPEFRQLGE
ncbi:MAG: TM2 domain-containing protein [Candidatus Sericytochromatia bacterium]